MMENGRRLSPPRNITVSAPPIVDWTDELPSTIEMLSSPATIAWSAATVAGTFVNSTSSPCSWKVPVSYATRSGVTTNVGVVQLATTRRGAAGALGGAGAAAPVEAEGGTPVSLAGGG